MNDPTYYAPFGLSYDHEYGFAVRVRDVRGNMTSISEICYAIVGYEMDPPLVNWDSAEPVGDAAVCDQRHERPHGCSGSHG